MLGYACANPLAWFIKSPCKDSSSSIGKRGNREVLEVESYHEISLSI